MATVVVVATVVVAVEARDDVVATVADVVLGELVGDDDETGTVVDDEIVDATIADEVSAAPSDPPLHAASAANIVATEAAAFHAHLMAAPPFGGC